MKTIVSLFSLVTLSFIIQAQDKGISFEHASWSELTAKAKRENKLIFVDAYASWCGPCKWMAKNVFTNDTVAEYYNKTFVCAKIDMEKGEGPELAKKWSVRNYPTLLYVDADGKIMHRTCGVDYNGAASSKFVNDGKIAIDPQKRLAAYKMMFENNKMNNNDIPVYFNMLQAACMNASEEAEKHLGKQPQKELVSQTNWNLIRNFIQQHDAKSFQYVVKNHSLFADRYTKDSVNTKIEEVYTGSLMKAAMSPDTSAYRKFKTEVLATKQINSEKITWYVDMELAERKKNWQQFSDVALKYMDKYVGNNANMLNSLTWTFYEHIDNPQALEQAVVFSKKSVTLDDSYANNDTYAALLFKTGKKSEAIKAAERAIELAKKSGEDYKATEELLSKINALK